MAMSITPLDSKYPLDAFYGEITTEPETLRGSVDARNFLIENLSWKSKCV